MKRSQKGMAGLETLLILVVIAILAFTGWYVYRARQNSNKTLSNASNLQLNGTSGSNASSQLSAGSNNSDLQTDLNSINVSQNQAASDGTSAGNAVNDQQSEITVPTN